MMMSSLTNDLVSAKHVHHDQTKVIQIGGRNHNPATIKANKSFKALLKFMNKDFYLYSHSNVKTFKKNFPIMKKCQGIIKRNLKHNWNIYTPQQLDQIAHNPDAQINEYGSFDSIADAIRDKEFYYTDYVDELAQQDNQLDTEIRSYLINDINNSRIAHGRRPLIVTNAMQQAANYRDPYVQYAYDHLSDYLKYPHNTSNPTDNWVHGMDTHTTASGYLKHQGYSHTCGANAGNWGSKYALNGDRTPVKYPNDTPEHIAENIDDGLMNHDNSEGNHNGHRKNELNPDWKYIGVGVTYNPQTHQGTFNEQFSK